MGSIRNYFGRIRRKLRLIPIYSVLRELNRRGIRIKDLRTLEVFGASGESHTTAYASLVGSLEVWELEPKFEQALKKNLPEAKVKITDSFREMKITPNKFGLIVIDNSMSTYGGYCEHFELFPHIFRVAENSAVIILNIIPEVDDQALKEYPYLFNEEQLQRRRAFYGTDHPQRLSIDEIAQAYRKHCQKRGFELEWCFPMKRNFVYYFVLKIRKVEAHSDEK